MTHVRSWTTILALSALVLAACDSGAENESENTSTTPTETPADPQDSDDTEANPALERARAILDLVNAEEPVTAEDWQGQLHESFLTQISEDDLADLVNEQVRPLRPFNETGFEQGSSQGVDEAVLEITSDSGFVMQIQVALDEDGLIIGLVFTPGGIYDHEPSESLDEVEERLQALATDVRALVVTEDADGQNSEDLLDLGSSEPAALASIFKLYVLGAVVTQVDSGEISWEDELTVTDEVKSLPSGELQDAETGTIVTVREAAQKMIEISDNTATDMLIEYVGRDAVEQTVTDFGHHDAERMQPFLTTQEVFALLWGGHTELAERWPDADVDERREIVTELDALEFDLAVEDLTAVTGWDKNMDWFASAEDVVNAHRHLFEMSADHPEISEILSANPGHGIHFDTDTWPYIGFKGGSSIGVFTLSWSATDDAGRQMYVVLQMQDPNPDTLTVNQAEIAGLAGDIFRLVAEG